MQKLFLSLAFLLSFHAYAGDLHPYKMSNFKAGKIVEKAGFYHGLHANRYIFGGSEPHSKVLDVKNHLGLSALTNKVTRSRRNLIDAASVTKEIQVRSPRDLVSCLAFIEYSKTTPNTPQALANVEVYKCQDQDGYPYPDFEFSYDRLEVTLIMKK